MTAAHKVRHRTGAGARFNPDSILIYRAVNFGVIMVAIAAVVVSWNGLMAVASWMLMPPELAWIVPVMLDFVIVVFTIGILPRKARGESVFLLALGAYALTAISSAANFAHVVMESPVGTPAFQVYAGAALAGLAPMLILLTTEVLALLITRPSKAESARKQEKLRDVKRELRAANRELKRFRNREAEVERLEAVLEREAVGV